MNYYDEIKNKLIDDEVYSKVKDYSKERHRVVTYFEIGKLLSEAGKHYGENIIGEYAKKLMVEINKKYNERTLRKYRQFYTIFKDEKWPAVTAKLTWSHYQELLPVKDSRKINYYVNAVINNN